MERLLLVSCEVVEEGGLKSFGELHHQMGVAQGELSSLGESPCSCVLIFYSYLALYGRVQILLIHLESLTAKTAA